MEPAAPKSESSPWKRRWFQYSLRTLLILLVLASIGLSWLAVRVQRAKRQREAVEAIGGRVTYDYQVRGSRPPAPAWMKTLLGEDIFRKVVGAVITTDSGMESLRELRDLEGLETRLLPGNITDAGLEHVQGLTQLKWLWLSRAHVTDAGLEHLKELPQLQELDLSETQVTGTGLRHLQASTQLTMVSFVRAPVTDAGLEQVKQFTQLEAIRLECNQISDAGLEHLRGLTNLRALHLESTEVTDEGVKRLQQALPDCKIHR